MWLATSAAGPISSVEVELTDWLALYNDGVPWGEDQEPPPPEPPHFGYFRAGFESTPYWLVILVLTNVLNGQSACSFRAGPGWLACVSRVDDPGNAGPVLSVPMTSNFLTNLAVATYGFAAGASVAVALFASWRHRFGVVVAAMLASISTMVAGLMAASPPPGQQFYSADRLRPWLVAVGAGSALICAGLIAVWRWKRTRLAAVAAIALSAFVIYVLLYSSVLYVSQIE